MIIMKQLHSEWGNMCHQSVFETHDHYAGQYVVDCNIARSKLGTCKIKHNLYCVGLPLRLRTGGITG